MQPVRKTRGSQALSEVLSKKTQQELAAETGVPQAVLSLLVNLKRSPGRKTANALAKVGIASAWWDEEPLAEPASAPDPEAA
ncbi:MAG TPA: helix-turn-helix transcriptional regulator [Polyangiaceae bacterium]|nr:helix-turn-helix transcriptional regulator [Polyangiaceae bacterium]